MATEAWKKENIEKLRKYRRDHYHRNAEHYIAQATAYNQTHKTKICNTCQIEKHAGEYRTKTVKGRTYLRFQCNQCDNTRTTLRQKEKKKTPEYKERFNGRNRVSRKDPEQRPKFIVRDCRRSDSKFQRSNDLDIEFVTECIRAGCSYCQAVDCMLVLDRKDNTQGHTKDNVNASCYRCNSIRGNMPYEAWLALVPAVRDVYQKGLFGEWKKSR